MRRGSERTLLRFHHAGLPSSVSGFGSTAYCSGLRFDRTFSIDAFRFITGLRQRLAAGLRVFEQSPVREITARGVVAADATPPAFALSHGILKFLGP